MSKNQSADGLSWVGRRRMQQDLDLQHRQEWSAFIEDQRTNSPLGSDRALSALTAVWKDGNFGALFQQKPCLDFIPPRILFPDVQVRAERSQECPEEARQLPLIQFAGRQRLQAHGGTVTIGQSHCFKFVGLCLEGVGQPATFQQLLLELNDAHVLVQVLEALHECIASDPSALERCEARQEFERELVSLLRSNHPNALEAAIQTFKASGAIQSEHLEDESFIEPYRDNSHVDSRAWLLQTKSRPVRNRNPGFLFALRSFSLLRWNHRRAQTLG